MSIFTAIFAGFGLSAPAGLNAWLTLLIVGLSARFHLFGLTLKSPYDVLTNTWVLVVLSVLLLIEVFVDKIPAVDSINDIIHTFIRPVAGGILFAAYSGAVGGLDPSVAFILGLLAAGTVHAAKASIRPVVTATTVGVGNPLVSFIEDIIAAIAVVLALVAPVAAGILMATLVALVFFFVFRWRARRRRRSAVP